MYKKFTFKILIISIFTLLVVALFAKHRFDEFVTRSIRPPYSRYFTKDDGSLVLSYFIRSKASIAKNWKVILIGDSQGYGHEFQQDKIFSAIIQNKLQPNGILNLSMHDGRMKDTIETIKALQYHGVRGEFLFLSVDEAHPQESDFSRYGAFSHIPDQLIFLFPRTILKTIAKEFEYTNPEQYKKHWYKDYFGGLMNPVYSGQVREALRLAKSIAQKVIVYSTPHPIESIEYLGYDRNYLRPFYSKVESIAEDEGAHYWDISQSFTKDHFFDMVHFNSKGHRRMARLICKRTEACEIDLKEDLLQESLKEK